MALSDPSPPTGERSKLLLMAGPIRYWWTEGVWDSQLHRDYVGYRSHLRRTLIEAGYLTYAPWEAFKGPWHESYQVLIDLIIPHCAAVLVMTPEGIPAEGTEREIQQAKHQDVSLVWVPMDKVTSVRAMVCGLTTIV